MLQVKAAPYRPSRTEQTPMPEEGLCRTRGEGLFVFLSTHTPSPQPLQSALMLYLHLYPSTTSNDECVMVCEEECGLVRVR